MVHWGDYVAATNIKGTDRVIQLLESYTEQLCKDLTCAAGRSLTTKIEADVSHAIKCHAVREENTIAAHIFLHDVCQGSHDTIPSFGNSICGQASVCQYNIECPIAQPLLISQDVFAPGIADSEIQLDLVGNIKQDMTFEEMLKFVESKKSSKCAASHLHDSKGSQAKPAVPTTDCDDRPIKTAQQIQMMSPICAFTSV